MFKKLTKTSRYSQNIGASTASKTIPATLFAGCPILLQFKHQSNLASSSSEINPDAPPLGRAMKKPIITGRHSKTHGYDIKEIIPNPFAGRSLPFGRRIVYENTLDEDLAKGNYWSKFVDRDVKFTDFDMAARAWGNHDLYRIPALKQPYDDISAGNDHVYEFRISNLGMHLEMMRHIPHLKPLWPEFIQRYKGVTRKFQDIVSQVLEDKESSFELSTTVVHDWREGIDYKHKAKESLKKQQSESKEDKRKRDLAEQISFSTIKKFLDNRVDEHEWVKLVFVDASGTKHYVYGMVGETLLQCCRRYSIPIDGYCNGFDRGMVRIYGEGAWCAQCQMDISPKYFHLMPSMDWRERNKMWFHVKEITPTSRLGCCIFIRPEFEGMVVSIPTTMFLPYGNLDDQSFLDVK